MLIPHSSTEKNFTNTEAETDSLLAESCLCRELEIAIIPGFKGNPPGKVLQLDQTEPGKASYVANEMIPEVRDPL